MNLAKWFIAAAIFNIAGSIYYQPDVVEPFAEIEVSFRFIVAIVLSDYLAVGVNI